MRNSHTVIVSYSEQMRSRYGNMIYVQAKYFLSEQMKWVSSMPQVWAGQSMMCSFG